MKYDDLEETKDLFDIVDVPIPIENIEMEGAAKENIKVDDKIEEKPVKEEKPKKSLKDKWVCLSKKKKIIIIISSIVLLVLIVTLILFLILNNDKTDKDALEKPSKPVVIVEKENYTYSDGVLTFKSESGTDLGTYECQNKDEKLCFVAYYESDDFDGVKNVYEDDSEINVRSKIYQDRYVFINDSKDDEDNIILYNIDSKKEEGSYTSVKGYDDEEYIILKNKSDKYGAIEIKNGKIEEKISFTYDYLGKINNKNKVVAKENKKYFIYSLDGKLESKGLDNKIKNYNDKYIVTSDYKLYDYKGNSLIKDTSEYIELYDNYFALVNDNKLYIRDYNNNKYNENGIKLDNKNYNVTNVYNKDNTLKESKRAYEITLKDNTLTISYKNRNALKTEVINLNEGNLSSNYAYLNYLNGSLYFYKDEEKAELLGTYSCTNKNTINSDTKELTNCTVHKTESGWLPIYNNRYIFINDSGDEERIVLYDLKNNKQLSKYSAINIENDNKENKITFKNTTGAYVIAKNVSNKYGVIRISDVVKGIINFNYTEINKLKDNFVAQESNGTYVMLDVNGNDLTQKYAYKIVDYNPKGYVLLHHEKNDKYGVMPYRGEGSTDALSYLGIKLFDDFYAAVKTDNTLYMQHYDNEDLLISPDDAITVKDINDFEIKVGSNKYLIHVNSTNKDYELDMSGTLIE